MHLSFRGDDAAIDARPPIRMVVVAVQRASTQLPQGPADTDWASAFARGVDC